DERAVEALIKALKDPDWYVRKAAAEALGRI
nr:Chain A, peptide HEAT_R1 [Methanothermobacter thermautotrophicus]6MK1_B Chain B, peptide HEAT_R1 [Methanothermobacter thermautotrophicus]6MK1_C Chain C, peptide HEAT_R1 [Methanothermobacter thermautotrophicus]6MK1_D Chain D, peptide HEAT_R1 [Methanothermobacter thermautotrophicus]6MK1_E Chain E, peptide HEAT_R1 [Methanothermobacter thermautotrophicus]6MK1_F Chain F, peptide HEAT_R1 [Methanothermobacter thermautotrophicus]6MK1_G Chain G, peptide HEAT_R1 [Methanothermobacter thermautotrophic